jgi:indole-3-glycerol phosphate synthase
MATGILHVNRDIILAMKRQNMMERQKNNPTESVLALAQMQDAPRYVMNLVEDPQRVTIFGQVTRTANLYDPVGSALDMVREGADAIMFFTDHGVYANDLEDMFMVARALKHIPIVYQNYVVNDYHVMGIRVADASGVLLYTSLLDQKVLRGAVTISQRWRLSVFVQVQTLDDIQYANTLSPHVLAFGDVLGSNAEAQLEELGRLRESIPMHTKVMLTQCLTTLDEVEMAIRARVNAVIVAPHLLKGDNAKKLRKLAHKL